MNYPFYFSKFNKVDIKMAIINTKDDVNSDKSSDLISESVQFICPVCKSSKVLKISKSVIKQANNLTSVSIPSGLICKHSFQAFIDKQFKVRGYQKVDFEFNYNPDKIQKDKIHKFSKNDEALFKNLTIKGNSLKYNPNNSIEYKETNQEKKEKRPQKKEMSLEEIYEEFWEFIDGDNLEFKEFIINDSRRH